jgi:hypothetical protein
MNSEMLTELRKLSEQDGTITAQVYRRLSLAALADVYERVGEVDEIKADLISLKKRSNIREGIIALGTIVGTILGVRE